MGPQVRSVGVGTGFLGKGLPQGPKGEMQVGEDDIGAGDTLVITALACNDLE